MKLLASDRGFRQLTSYREAFAEAASHRILHLGPAAGEPSVGTRLKARSPGRTSRPRTPPVIIGWRRPPRPWLALLPSRFHRSTPTPSGMTSLPRTRRSSSSSIQSVLPTRGSVGPRSSTGWTARSCRSESTAPASVSVMILVRPAPRARRDAAGQAVLEVGEPATPVSPGRRCSPWSTNTLTALGGGQVAGVKARRSTSSVSRSIPL